MNSFVNFSEVAYATRFRGNFAATAFPIACIRCVLPRPTPPYRNSGVYAWPGRAATDSDAPGARRVADPRRQVEGARRRGAAGRGAGWARRFAEPAMKVEKF